MAGIKVLDLHFLGHKSTISSFLIKTSEGPVLIETGPHSAIESLMAGLRTEGVAAEDVKHVLLTHIHLDHAGAAWYFAGLGAQVYVHPLGVRHLVDPSRLMDSARRIYQEKMDYLWGQMHPILPARLTAVEHGEVIGIGEAAFEALHTPGHASHHIAWKMGDTLFAGDVAGVKIENGPVVAPCPPPDIDIEAWHESLRLIVASGASQLYLTHFGKITNVGEHVEELKNALATWADWIKVRVDEGLSIEEMTPLFKEFVATDMAAQGLATRHIDQYEAANPAWMSVAGLVRYWSKKGAKA